MITNVFQHSNVATTLPLSRPSNRFVSTKHSTKSSRSPGRLSVVRCSTSLPGKVDDLPTKLETSPGAEELSVLKERPVLSRPPRVYAVKDEDLVVDKVLTGRVKSIMTFGAFVDLGARIDGLLHISKLGAGYVRNVEDVIKVGEEVKVQITAVDIANRRVKLQRCVPEGEVAANGRGTGTGTTGAVNSRMNTSPGTGFRTNGAFVKVVAQKQTAPETGNKETASGKVTATTGTLSQAQNRDSSGRTGTINRLAASKPTVTETEKVEASPGKPAASTQTLQRESATETPAAASGKGTTQLPTPRATTNKRFVGAAGTRFSPKPQGVKITKTSYQKGQVVMGVVKNFTKRGCFVQLPGNEEGFLHANEVNESMEPIPIEKLVKVGEEVKVRVLRIIDGRLNLTVKEELDVSKINEKVNQNAFATNPFELAFRQNPITRSYLEKSGRLKRDGEEELNE